MAATVRRAPDGSLAHPATEPRTGDRSRTLATRPPALGRGRVPHVRYADTADPSLADARGLGPWCPVPARQRPSGPHDHATTPAITRTTARSRGGRPRSRRPARYSPPR